MIHVSQSAMRSRSYPAVLPNDPERAAAPEFRPQAGVAEMQTDDMVKLDTVNRGWWFPGISPMGRLKNPPFLRPASGRNEGVFREDTLTMSVKPAETQRCEKASPDTSMGIA
jgi:hypothetical protein